MRFCTAISCMDGRIQLPVIHYLQNRYSAEYVDMITEPGPCLVLSKLTETGRIESILERMKISAVNHGSVGMAVAAHPDCARNPIPKEEQIKQVCDSLEFVRIHYPQLPIVGLWVEDNRIVHEI